MTSSNQNQLNSNLLVPESHFNTDHTKIEKPSEIEHMLIYIQSSQNPSTSINNNEWTDEEIKKDNALWKQIGIPEELHTYRWI